MTVATVLAELRGRLYSYRVKVRLSIWPAALTRWGMVRALVSPGKLEGVNQSLRLWVRVVEVPSV